MNSKHKDSLSDDELAYVGQPPTEDELAYIRRSVAANALPYEIAGYLISLMAVALAMWLFSVSYKMISTGGLAPGIAFGVFGIVVALPAYFFLPSFRSAPQIAYHTCVVSGPLSWSHINVGGLGWRQYYIGREPVRFPRHWQATLENWGRTVTARTAMRSDLLMATPVFPLHVLEIEDGPSIPFELGEAGGRLPPERFWGGAIIGALILPLIGAVAFLIDSVQDRMDYSAAARAAYASLFQHSVYADSESLNAAKAAPGRTVTIKAGWRLDPNHLDPAGLPANATMVVIGQTARDRIVAQRKTAAEAFAVAWEEYEGAMRRYNDINPIVFNFNPNRFQPPARRDPNLPEPAKPKAPLQKLEPGDVMAYFNERPDESLYVADGVEPVSESLKTAHMVSGIVQTADRPLLLKPLSKEKNLREGGYFLAGSIAVFGAMAVVLAMAVRSHMRRRKFVEHVRMAYARKRNLMLE